MDFDAALKTLDDQPLLFDNNTELTLGLACTHALLNAQCRDQRQKFERWELARDITKRNIQKLTSEQIVMIKECANEVYATPVVFGPLAEALEA